MSVITKLSVLKDVYIILKKKSKRKIITPFLNIFYDQRMIFRQEILSHGAEIEVISPN
ncbi:hypothetical protein CCAN12_340003 [Capnocytophaga canimorsus]|uniref:Uncharacterized protein n=1 Tax=Capnocytophaga canimorsus TaxID=28188 RepID=A0A0B7H160_9FLAO|nr:hypothetical protein [Capnocytophaga canimorsus]CEN33115.1 hypothetical protein CCAN12_340003 [Capnocytophaga canimorsus]